MLLIEPGFTTLSTVLPSFPIENMIKNMASTFRIYIYCSRLRITGFCGSLWN